jgi:hypothetical protein
MILNSSQIAKVLNEIYDGVERSKLGGIVVDNFSTDPQGNVGKILNQLPYQTFLILVQNIIPKRFDSITEFKMEE